MAPTGPLADFPLALGYPRENGDDDSAVVVQNKPASKRFGECPVAHALRQAAALVRRMPDVA